MKVLVAGATGALGKQLVPLLIARGHEVAGMTRTPAKADALRALGATPLVADALDADAVGEALAQAQPEVVVHQLTALSGSLDMRHFDRDFAQTNRLRTEGTDHLLAAARAAGARRFVAQSYAGWPYARTGGAVKTEDDPLDPDPVPAMRETLAAIRHLEAAVTSADGIEGLVLRYGGFYGPGTSLGAQGGEHAEVIRSRRFPIVGNGRGVWSFVHIADAAEATALAVERGRPGIYNIVDDEPAPVREWLPAMAAALGAKPPRRVPRTVGRLVAGAAAAVMMTEVRGASNAKAKAELGWEPRHPSWRTGFTAGPHAAVAA
jgi:nucleoside-diphosphate-sugar epimerase